MYEKKKKKDRLKFEKEKQEPGSSQRHDTEHTERTNRTKHKHLEELGHLVTRSRRNLLGTSNQNIYDEEGTKPGKVDYVVFIVFVPPNTYSLK